MSDKGFWTRYIEREMRRKRCAKFTRQADMLERMRGTYQLIMGNDLKPREAITIVDDLINNLLKRAT